MEIYLQYEMDDIAEVYHKETLEHKDVDKATLYVKKIIENCFPNEKILDVGCGSGIDMFFMLAKGLDVWGVEPSKRLIAEAVSSGVPEKRIACGVSSNLPFQDTSFGLVYSIFVLHYLSSGDLDRTYKEVYRILKNEGEFVFAVNHPQVDYLEKIGGGKNVTITLFGGRVPITFPKRKSIHEYFNKTFFKLFDIVDIYTYKSTAQDKKQFKNNIHNVMCVYARKKIRTSV